ncbi:MAG TPA: hypothetical protein PLR25_06195 [Planctomycetaceae bacterium]|nr:hypothetical protein [Planctomycetaceae bacterium]
MVNAKISGHNDHGRKKIDSKRLGGRGWRAQLETPGLPSLRFVQPRPPFNLTSVAVKYTVTDVGYKDAEKSADMTMAIMIDSL